MRHLLLPVLCLACLSINVCGRVADDISETGVRKLAGVGYFAFGPVGVTELSSNGEAAFRELWKKDFSEAYFVELFQQGTAEGKCYALVGLRELSSEYFTKYSEALRKTGPLYINVISGRFLGQTRTSEILAEIEAGRYTGYFKDKRA